MRLAGVLVLISACHYGEMVAPEQQINGGQIIGRHVAVSNDALITYDETGYVLVTDLKTKKETSVGGNSKLLSQTVVGRATKDTAWFLSDNKLVSVAYKEAPPAVKALPITTLGGSIATDADAVYFVNSESFTVMRLTSASGTPTDTGIPGPVVRVAVNNDSIIAVTNMKTVAFFDKATGAAKGAPVDPGGDVVELIGTDAGAIAILGKNPGRGHRLAIINNGAVVRADVEAGEPFVVTSGGDAFVCAYKAGWVGELRRFSLAAPTTAKVLAGQNESDCPIGVSGGDLYFFGVGGIRRASIASMPK